MRRKIRTTFLTVAAVAMIGLPAAWSVGSADFDGDGDIDFADFAALSLCLNGPQVAPDAECTVDADFDDDGDADLGDIAAFQVSFNGSGIQPTLPAKTIQLDLIGIHDPRSDFYDSDCVGCHGFRTNEVALDGVSLTTHGQMLVMIPGEGNDRCVACHDYYTDFLSRSAGGLRKQVDLEVVECTWCHGRWTGGDAWYARPQ